MKRGLWLATLAAGFGGCSLDYGAFSVESDSAGGTGNTGAQGTGAASGGSDPSGGAAAGGEGGTAAGPNGGGESGGAGGVGALGGAGGAAPTTCAEQYSLVPQFLFCAESATQCEFVASNSVTSCTSHCALYGGECLDAWDNDAGTCNPVGGADCGTVGLINIVCVCSLGCGGGPACMLGETCSGGSCM